MLEVVLGFSQHLIDGDFNEIHPGLRYEQNHVVAALYYNSLDNVTFALGFVGRTEIAGQTVFGEIGLATGYDYPVIPFGRVGIEFEHVRYFIAPAVTKTDAGIVVGVEMRF